MNTNTPNNQGFPPPSNGWVPPAPQPPKGQNNGGREFFDAIRRSGYFRSQSRWVGGVAGGLARRLNVDPLVIRALIVVLGVVFTGLALVAYAIAWALLPEESDGRIHSEEALKGNFDGALIVIILGVTVGFSSMGAGIFGFDFLPGPLVALFWLAFLGALGYVGYLIYQKHSENSKNTQGSQVPPAGQAAAGSSTDAGSGQTYPRDGSAQGFTANTTPQGNVPPARPTAYETGASQPYTQQSARTQGFTGNGQSAPPPSVQLFLGQNEPAKYSYMGSQNASWNGYQSPQYSDPSSNSPSPYQWTPPKAPGKPDAGGNGIGQFAVLAGLLLLIGAGLMAASLYGGLHLDVPVITLIIGAGLLLGGVATIINGIRGARSGAAGWFTFIGLLAALFVAAPILFGFDVTKDNFENFSDRDLAPTSLEELEHDISFGVGELSIDLSGIDQAEFAALEDTKTITVSGGVGDITIYVPESLDVTASSQVGIGDYTDPFQKTSGIGNNTVTLTQDSDGNTIVDPDLTFDVSLGIGSIRFDSVPATQ